MTHYTVLYCTYIRTYVHISILRIFKEEWVIISTEDKVVIPNTLRTRIQFKDQLLLVKVLRELLLT